MVYDGAVKDDQESSAAPATSPAVSETSSAAPAEAVVRAIPAHDKRLGVRHPLKHRRFRAGGKMMVEPGGVPSAPAVVEGEVEEVEASEVEEVEDEDTTSAETEMQSVDVEVSSAPASVIPVVEEMEVEGAKTELSHEAEVALALEARAEEEDEEVVSSAPPPVIPVVEEMEVEGSEMELSAEAAVALALEAQAEEEEDEEVVSSLVAAQGDDNKQEATPADSVNDMDEDKEREEKEKKERERQKERERADEVGYMSGGWKSPDGSLNCGYSSFRGKRASMEDFYDIKSSKIDDKQISLFGIFDGHGGSRAAEYLKEHLFENLMKHPEFMTNVKLAISETYKKTDSDFLDSERTSHRDDGSTASTAVLMGDHLYVANVGDSRAVISKAGKAIALSEDHKPNRSDERKRIENAGGIVMWAGTWRVGGVLAMSRAFGNRLLKQFVIAEPEIQEQEINNELEFLIIASDGLWDVVPNEDAVSLVRMEEEPEAAARKLTETAYSRGSGDNITCIVVKFQHDKMGSDSPSSSNES